jgi:hypothetical protein
VTTAPARAPKKAFPIGIVGESKYQRSIAACHEEDEVLIWHEADNPYDERALAVTARGETIGYIPRDSFLHRGLLDEKQACSARIMKLQRGHERGNTGVVIEVELLGRGEAPLAQRGYEDRQ